MTGIQRLAQSEGRQEDIRNIVKVLKAEGFTPTQARMQLAFAGASNEEIREAIPTATEWYINLQTGQPV